MNVIRLLSLTAIYCLMVAMLNGCDRDDETSTMPSNPGSSNSAVASATLGPAGGMISSSDGSLTLTIPPGALTQEETITIDVIDLSQLPPEFLNVQAQAYYELGPDGLTFNQPVQISVLTSSQVEADGTVIIPSPTLYTSRGGVIAPLDNIQNHYDGIANRASANGELSHFSPVVYAEYEVGDGERFAASVIVAEYQFSIRQLSSTTYQLFTQYMGRFVVGEDITPIQTGTLVVDDAGTTNMTFVAGTDGTATYTCINGGDAILGATTRTTSLFEQFAIPERYHRTGLVVECPSTLPEPPPETPPSTDAPTCDDVDSSTSRITLTGDLAIFFGSVGFLQRPEGFASIGCSSREQQIRDSLNSGSSATNGIRPSQTRLLAPPPQTGYAAYSVSSNNGVTFLNPDGTVLASGQGSGNANFGHMMLYGPNDATALFEYGPNSALTHFVNGQFSSFIELVAFTDNVIDALPLSNDPLTGAAILVNYTQQRLNFLHTELDMASGGFFIKLDTTLSIENAFDSLSGNLISAYATANSWSLLGRSIKHDILVISEGTATQPGSVATIERTTDNSPLQRIIPITTVHCSVGRGARRLRCIEQDKGSTDEQFTCAVSNHDDGTLSIIKWDGFGGVAVTATVDVGDGPIEIDLRQNATDKIGIVSTGFNDDSVSVTWVNLDGTIHASMTQPIGNGCVAPGHAQWIGNRHFLISCNGSDLLVQGRLAD